MAPLALLLVALCTLDAEEKFASAEMRARTGAIERAPMSFRAAGLYWRGEGAARIRVSADAAHWTAWLDAPVEYDVDGFHASDVISFGRPARYLHVEAPGGEVRVVVIDPGDTEDAGRRAPLGRSAETPRIVSRADWGCTPEACAASSPPSYTTVTHLVVHHSAGNNTAADWAAVVRSIWILHVRGNGWNDIGYNYLIDPNGVLYEGRAGGDGVLGAHFSGVNSGTMGVCVMGTYSTVAATEAALEALRALLVWQAAKWKIDPGGRSLHASSGLELNHISGHRDAGLSPRATSTTECPGNAVYAALPQLRRDVRALAEGSCPLRIDRSYRCASAEAQTLDAAVTLPEGCTLDVRSRAAWISAATEQGMTRLALQSNPDAVRAGTVAVNGQTISIAQAAAGQPAPPCVDFRGVVSAAFDERPVVPGALISLIGENLASTEAKADTWPDELDGVSVRVNGWPIPLVYVSPSQINAQLPAATNTGSNRLQVISNGAASPERLFWVTEAVPSILAVDGAAASGSTIGVYLTGAGSPSLPRAATPGVITAWESVEGLAGVMRAGVRLPDSLTPGEYELAITIGGVTSSPALIRVPSP